MRAVYFPLRFPLHQEEDEGKRKEGRGESYFIFFLIKGKFLTGKITSILNQNDIENLGRYH